MGRFGGKGDNDRALTTKEMELIRRVFASAPLPSLLIISIGDGVNAQGGAWTDSDYQINVGPMLYNSDLTVTAPATLVHEMTHVGQYHQGTLTKAHAFFAHVLHGFARRSEYLYDYTLGDSWDDFGFEGQAQMVEDWYDNDKMSTVGHRFVYIEKVLRTGNPLTRSLTLEEAVARSYRRKASRHDATRFAR